MINRFQTSPTFDAHVVERLFGINRKKERTRKDTLGSLPLPTNYLPKSDVDCQGQPQFGAWRCRELKDKLVRKTISCTRRWFCESQKLISLSVDNSSFPIVFPLPLSEKEVLKLFFRCSSCELPTRQKIHKTLRHNLALFFGFPR
jgi:hypothetical protein